MTVTHFAIEFGLWHKCRNRIHHEHVYRSRTDQCFGDFKRLLSIIRLRDQKIVHIYAEFFCIARIERMLGINERRHSTLRLRLGNHLQCDRRFTGRFRPEDFNHSSARKAADSERGVK